MQILDKQDGLRQYAGPGHWNDPDMLEVGNGMAVNQDRAHFSMWAMLAAPLIAGNDLRKMSQQTIEILTNKGVIAVNQNELGIQAFKHSAQDSLETWYKPLKNGDWAVCFLNRSKAPKTITYNWQEIIRDSFSKREFNAATDNYTIQNLWNKRSPGTTKKMLNTVVPAQDVLMLRLTKQ
jgi:alpha-galactosidase